MFWDAIVYGLRQMAHLEIWIAIFLYGLMIGLLFMALKYSVSNNKRKGGFKFSGLLTLLVKGHFLQTILIAVIIVLLLPILAGGDEFAPLGFIADNFWEIFKVAFIAAAIVYIISLVPVIRKFISKSPGTVIFVEGTIIFHLLANRVFTDLIKMPTSSIVLPGYISTLWLLVLLFIIVHITTRYLTNLLIQLKILDEYAVNRHTFLIGNFVGIFPSIFCLCIYCEYIYLTMIEASTHALV